MALAIDASTPAAAAAGSGVSTITSNTFSPPANSVIFVCVAASSNSALATQTVSSMTDSLGSHLTWSLLKASDSANTGVFNGLTTFAACTEIWYAPCPTSHASMTVTATLGTATYGVTNSGMILPIVFTGAMTTQAGATNSTSSSSAGTPSCAVTGTAVGSWTIAVGQISGTGVTSGPTDGASQTNTINGSSSVVLSSGNIVGFSQIQTGTGSGGTETINDTAPTGTYNMAVVEVRAIPSLAGAISATSTMSGAVTTTSPLTGSVSDSSSLSGSLVTGVVLGIHSSTPAPAVIAGGVSSAASNSFSPPANSFILVAIPVFCTSTTATVTGVTDSLGSHLTWNRMAHVVQAGSPNGIVCEIWGAQCPSAQTGMTVTASFSAATYAVAGSPEGEIQPIVFTGAATTQAGATNTVANGAAAAVSCAVTGTAVGSWIVGTIATASATAPTVPSGQTTTINGNSTQELNATLAAGFYTQIGTTTGSGGTQTINDTAPSGGLSAAAVVEVQVAPAIAYLGGSVVGSSSMSGVMTAPALLSGAVSGVATTAGAITAGSGGLGGAVSAAATMAGAVNTTAPLVGAVSGTSTFSGSISGGAPTGLAIDPSTPTAAVIAGGVSSSASNSFSPPANSYILLPVTVFCTSTTASVTGVTDSLGSHLTWSRLAHTVQAGTPNGIVTEIWGAPCPSAQTGMTVTASFSAPSYAVAGSPEGEILPIVFTGAASTQAGANNTAIATSGVATCAVTGTAVGSWIVGVIAIASSTAPTVPSGQTTTVNGSSTQQLNATLNAGFYVQIETTTGSGGTQTINDTAPAGGLSAMAVVEVQATPVTPALSGSVSSSSSMSGAVTTTSPAVLAGAISATSTMSGSLSGGTNLSGAITGISTVSGTTKTTAPLVGSVSSTSTVTGAIGPSSGPALSGSVSATSSMTGAFPQAPITPSPIVSTSTMAASIVFLAYVGGSINGVSSMKGAVGTPVNNMVGAINATSAFQGQPGNRFIGAPSVVQTYKLTSSLVGATIVFAGSPILHQQGFPLTDAITLSANGGLVSVCDNAIKLALDLSPYVTRVS